MIDLRNVEFYMIVVKGNEASEYYADYCIPSWETLGVKVNRFDAITPKQLPKLKELKFSKYSSGSKYLKRKLKADITETEQACFYSHYTLWKKSIELNKPVMIIEHDAYLENPEKIWYDSSCGIMFFDMAAMGSYIINPWFAQQLTAHVRRQNISIGPYGMIAGFGKENNLQRLIVNDIHPLYDPGSRQVMSKKYGNTVIHYCNLYPEHFPPEAFHQFKMIE